MTTPLDILIAQGEHQQQDFKYKITNVNKIAHSLSAFANTAGGRLLIGVRDNGTIAGVRSEEEIYMIDAAACIFCRPEVECSMEATCEGGNNVVIATVAPSIHRPVMAKEEDGSLCAYVRVADENIVATPVHLALWRRQHLDVGSLLTYTDKERSLLSFIAMHPQGVSINRVCKHSAFSRKKSINLLADFVRFELIDLVFVDHQFVLCIHE